MLVDLRTCHIKKFKRWHVLCHHNPLLIYNISGEKNDGLLRRERQKARRLVRSTRVVRNHQHRKSHVEFCANNIIISGHSIFVAKKSRRVRMLGKE